MTIKSVVAEGLAAIKEGKGPVGGLTDTLMSFDALATFQPLSAVQEITRHYSEYNVVKEQEETKREEIYAWKDTTLAEIKAKREILLRYLDESFDERKENFKKLFDALDETIEKGMADQVAVVLNSITDLAKSTPFKDIASIEKVREIMSDPKRKIEL